MSRYATAVCALMPRGVPMVRERHRKWKLPGGRSEGDETARECAVRELAEETGLVVLEDDLQHLYAEDRGTHHFAVFETRVAGDPPLKSEGDEGEEVAIFSIEDLMWMMEDIVPSHAMAISQMIARVTRE